MMNQPEKCPFKKEIFQLCMPDKILSVVGRHNQAADQLDWQLPGIENTFVLHLTYCYLLTYECIIHLCPLCKL